MSDASITRRELLAGSAALAMGISLGACGEDKGDDDRVRDITLLRSLSSLEALAVEFYAAPAPGIVLDPGTTALFDQFRGHHQEHATETRSATRAIGGTPEREPNHTVLSELVEPGRASATDASHVIRLALDIETVLAQSHSFVVASLASGRSRTAIARICGSEARHVAAFSAIVGDPIVPSAFSSTVRALEPRAFV